MMAQEQARGGLVRMFRQVLLAMAILIGGTINLCGVLVLWSANDLSQEVGWPLLAFAALVDGMRFAGRRGLLSLSSVGPGISRCLDVLLQPRAAYYLLGGTAVLLFVLYYALPSYCPVAINEWIARHIGLAARRVEHIGDACSVAHGSMLLFAQAALLLTCVLTSALLSIAEVYKPQKFQIKPVKKAPPPSGTIALLSFGVYFAFLSGQAFLPFDVPGDIAFRARVFVPQENVLAFAFLIIASLFPMYVLRYQLLFCSILMPARDAR